MKKIFFLSMILTLLTSCFSFSDYTKRMIKENKLKSHPQTESKAPFNANDFASSDFAVSWLGHATVLVKMNGITFITDPVIFNRIGPPEFANNIFGIKRLIEFPLKPKKIPHIDYILISHAHYDHLDLPSIKYLIKHQKIKPIIIIPRDTKDLLSQFDNVEKVELDWHGNKKVYKNGSTIITAFQVEHYSSTGYGNRKKNRGFNGYIISCKNRSIAFFGDTSYYNYRNWKGEWTGKRKNIDWKTRVQSINSQIDLAIIPVGDYYYSNHSSPAESIEIFKASGAKKLLPIHYDTFILSPPEFYKESPGRQTIRLCLKNNSSEAISFKSNNKDISITEPGLILYP